MRADTPDDVCEYLTGKLNEAILSEGYIEWSKTNYHAPYTDLYTPDEIMELLLIERWESEAHQRVHLQQPHMDAVRAAKAQYIDSTELGKFRLED